MDDARLKNPDGLPDYYDELLNRIRDIRAFEKRFYQKIRDLLRSASTMTRLTKQRKCFSLKHRTNYYMR